MKPYKKIADTKLITKEEWIELRKTGIGGSDAGGIVGLNPYSNPYSIYHEKLSIVEGFEGNDKTRLGTDLEEYVAKRFEEATGKKVRRLNAMLRSVEHPYMIADVDRLVIGEEAGLECKTTSNYDGYKFDEGEYPAYWFCQVYHYLAVTGLKKWYICVLDLNSGKVSTIEIERDETEIFALIQMEKDFWNNHIVPRVVPMPSGGDRCEDIIAKKYPVSNDELPTVDLMAYDKDLARLADVKSEIKALEDEKSKLEQSLKEALGEASKGEYGLYKVSFKTSSSQRIDTKRLKMEMPEVYDRYSSVMASRRFVFTVTK